MYEFGKFNEKKLRKGEMKMKKLLIGMITLVVVAVSVTGAFAGSSQTVNVNAIIPTVSGGLTVTIKRVVGTVWTTDTAINFGTLALDPVNNIFLPADKRYYAVDVGVADNSGTVWTVTHTRQSLKKDVTNNLDSNVNVTFVKQKTATTFDLLSMVSFGNSNSVAYTKTQLAGGWLRLYYGIGAGDPDAPDATGVTPIGLDKPAGTYTGAVTITLAP